METGVSGLRIRWNCVGMTGGSRSLGWWMVWWTGVGNGNTLPVSGITVQYRGQSQPALRDVTFELRRGERTALLGASGCGKTTLCRVLLGALPPGTRVEGSIRRDAVRMAYVPQETAESLHPMLQAGTGKGRESCCRRRCCANENC